MIQKSQKEINKSGKHQHYGLYKSKIALDVVECVSC